MAYNESIFLSKIIYPCEISIQVVDNAIVLSKRENIILLNNGAVNIIYDDIDSSDCLYVNRDFKGFGLQSF